MLSQKKKSILYPVYPPRSSSPKWRDNFSRTDIKIWKKIVNRTWSYQISKPITTRLSCHLLVIYVLSRNELNKTATGGKTVWIAQLTLHSREWRLRVWGKKTIEFNSYKKLSCIAKEKKKWENFIYHLFSLTIIVFLREQEKLFVYNRTDF